jgi:oligopeptide transport system permease protein
MLLEATLSFLGLGIQPPDASWGVLISEGAASMAVYPWMLIGPSLFFSATLLALNLLGDALRDALDPKSVQE